MRTEQEIARAAQIGGERQDDRSRRVLEDYAIACHGRDGQVEQVRLRREVAVAARLARRHVAGGREVARGVVGVENLGPVGGDSPDQPPARVANKSQPVAGGADDAVVGDLQRRAIALRLLDHACATC